MISTRRKSTSEQRLLSHLNESLNDSTAVNNTNADVAEIETLEFGSIVSFILFGGQQPMELVQVMIKKMKKVFADRIRKEVDNAVTAVENWVDDAILAAMETP